jgi:hypothetical protein
MAEWLRPDFTEMKDTHDQLVMALALTWRIAERGGPDFAGSLAAALQELSEALGGVGVVVRSRPGSWEAADVRHLGATMDDWGL